ncbi:MAG: diphosphate--fructose-6-phosphate 1-phosphotransferase, partial [Rhodobiaceae bacterium]|nr:diphosphate--fructose-6-phosphate 1-phosphotransferase [Rhodobiaceae bacterium]
IGGNDSSDTVRIVAEEAQAAGYPLKAVHIPKTVDNDLMCNDHTPGFGSAARFVAQAFTGVNLDNRALPGVYIAVLMGRHAGFLTAASALARKYEDDGPHVICLPERNFDMDTVLAKIKATYNKVGRCIVAVSEGIHDAAGDLIATSLMKNVERDAHGNVSLSGSGALGDLLAGEVKDKLGIGRVRADTLGYMQRAFAGCVSDVDAREARDVGEVAARVAIRDGKIGSVTINRVGNYAAVYGLVDLKEVAAKTRVMSDDFITADSLDVTSAFLDYVRPLAGSNLPDVYRFNEANRVEKKIG